MKTFTEKQLFDWLKEQPDDRPIDMGNGWLANNFNYEDTNSCACILGEFLRDQGFTDGYVCTNGELRLKNQTKAKVELNTVKNIFGFFKNDEEGFDDWHSVGDLKKTLKYKRLIK